MKIFVVVLLVVLVAGCSSGWGSVCDERSEEVAFARGLSQARLARLFDDAQRLAATPRARDGWRHRGRLPSELRDLDALSARRQGGELEIVLKHCVDERIVLSMPVDGSGREVLLWWSEGATVGRQVLWPRSVP